MSNSNDRGSSHGRESTADGIAKVLGFETVEDAAQTAKKETLRPCPARVGYRPPLGEGEALIAP